ncbi:MAG: hypothetical protein HYV04_06430, partial [Deltaproteobacteria bacterium]|nr:hypothetical protein [Deltaproteobacteria bacterium]
ALPRESRLGVFLWLASFLILVFAALLGFLPPTARDELAHHLALPRLYAGAGRIFEVPFALYSYYPMLLDMLYVPWVQWGWDSVPKLIHGLFGLLTGLLVYAYLARRLNPVYGLVGFSLFVSMPAVLRLSHWAYVDLGVAFYSAAALLCLLQWIEGRERRMANGEWRMANGERSIPNPQFVMRNSFRNPQSAIRNFQFPWLVLAGLCAGFAVATKPNGLLALLLLFLLLLLVLAREADRKPKKFARDAALFLGFALLPAIPWWLRNLLWTGNPLFPFFTSLFGGGSGGGGGGGGSAGLGIFAQRELLYGESWWEIAVLPWRVFFVGQDDQPQYFDGVLNPMLILFLPWAFKGKWLEEKKLLFGFALLYFLYALFLTELRIRYILPIVPPLVILLVYSVHNIYLRIARPLVLFGVLVLLLALNGIYFANHLRSVSPAAYLLGRESRESYLARMLAEYPAIQYINGRLPGTAKIYFLFIGRRVYYCERAYFHDQGEYPAFFLRLIRNAQRGEDVEVGLREKGITHLFLRVDLFLRFLANNFTAKDAEIWRGGYAIYEIRNAA